LLPKTSKPYMIFPIPMFSESFVPMGPNWSLSVSYATSCRKQMKCMDETPLGRTSDGLQSGRTSDVVHPRRQSYRFKTRQQSPPVRGDSGAVAPGIIFFVGPIYHCR
jgi:hypothetical protein